MPKRALPFVLSAATLVAAHAALAYPRQAEIARGRYLTEAGDCMACHSDAERELFSGNRAVATPFGTVYSSNITPDRETGIGAWTEPDFYRALHEGIRKDGAHLYPAMPYTEYTKLTRADVDAIFTYLETVPSVRSETKAPQLTWPLGWRWLMTFWNWLYFDKGTFRPDTDRNAQWNRGAYLVRGAGHCGACHTPRNFLGGAKTSRFLAGGVVQNWFAPMLAANPRNGLGHWTAAEIVGFLKNGRNDKTAAFGPMSEVIADSTNHLNGGDLAAIASYLKAQGTISQASPPKPDDTVMRAGGRIFAAQCAACHQAKGVGVAYAFASLAGSANAQSSDPKTVIRAILTGVRAVPTSRRPTGFAMPGFDWKLSDEEVAAVGTYIRNSWGNAAAAISAGEVGDLRRRVEARKPERRTPE